MTRYQVKKVVAVCFLEATKIALDHLGQYRMDLSQRGASGASSLPGVYGDLRRLRDYLQRCISAFPECVELEFEPADQGLLVASCRRAVDVIDLRTEGAQALAEQEREWLRQKRQVLSDWAVEMAAKPLIELPLPRIAPTQNPGGKALALRLSQKLYTAVAVTGAEAARRYHGAPAVSSPQASGAGAGWTGSSLSGLHDESFEGPAGSLARPRLRGVAAVDDDPGPGPASQPSHAPSGSQGFLLGMVGEAAADDDPRHQYALFDEHQVRDPRLRSLMALDQRAYGRAIEARDFRLAAVHLCSLLEGAVLDHALPRRVELGLSGTPESWKPQEIVLQVLGHGCTPRDRSLLYHVFLARNVVRPAVLLVSPIVVTLQSLERLAEFVCRVLREMGFDAPHEVNYSGQVRRAVAANEPAALDPSGCPLGTSMPAPFPASDHLRT
jgi:hypothetical protein